MMSPEGESWTSWLCDLEPEDCNFLNESDTNWAGEISFPSEAQEQNLQRSFTIDSNHSHSTTTSTFKTEHCSSTMSNSSSGEDDNTTSERPSKTLKMSNASPSYILSFSNENPAHILNFDSTLKPKSKALTVNVNHHGNRSLESQKKETKRKVQEGEKARSPHQAQDHIIAERKRREKISQQFIALSALIPGLKKMDKASVLGDAIQHVKQLQEQVKLLEEQSQRKSSESVVYVEKSKSSVVDDDVSLSDTSSNSDNSNNFSLPEVEARVSENKVLIRIHCEKQEGVLMNILKEIHNLNLSVINCSTLLFGTSKLDITIIAEMDDGFRLSVKELARKLRVGLLQFM
ncbi:transcription factor bHLH18-like [Lotus japonicus]|uniref:transcription factor bHLH18-like n=1 Tax=Lotus japonicus TaxID=34305 RepID=UPI00258585CB|nr:transcription factor bHLH18-like [Lotus japonicus]XP_057449669.1 transcription factor bHLH18-like [Lotus japonicus]